ncbi:polyamine aminopropyltransferase [Pontibacillus yanchengensis]|uniref:Polyamine aminopropyltransferase n=2 Tax=Pontibacillus yanchengensis TaxID=462910 RepID=A0ACC7VGG0_9BACI|nr:polyamine aminopropyltransferase [Pontibacillus yanchengensis]MYL34126.1 polyamine aminopropyltransferase [Pontibacillus yanchengensis]MYL53219.1 polyamine aminopropyltransferase [Pontibacillus yanchengensis]
MNKEAERKSKFIYWASGIVSICGIIFEVLFGALGSYILGDGVKQYTLTISLFLTGMGVGASLSERVLKNLIVAFVLVEFAVAFLGGFSSLTMFAITAFTSAGTDALYLYFITFVIGALTGIELPILIRKANEIGVELNKSTARVLFSDYAGGLIGGLLFVFLLRPQMGMVQSAFVVGCINLVVALVIVWLFRHEIKHVKRLVTIGALIGISLVWGVLFGEEQAVSFEKKLYKDPIIHLEDTAYQRIVLTKEQGDTRLYLNGALQFSSSDEYRYHEPLIHIPMGQAEDRKKVLILGGGDGIAVREVLKHEEVESITLVELDPRMTELANENFHLLQLNKGSLKNEKVNIVHQDAFEFMENNDEWYDIIISDLPDPNNESLNKLYTKEFYSLLRNHLNPAGAMMVQSTSPVFATSVYWTISNTITATGLYTENVHVDIPSFGNWGFVLASRKPIQIESININVPTEFLTSDMIPSLTYFGKDEDEVIKKNGSTLPLPPNTLIDPHLIQKYEEAWKNY